MYQEYPIILITMKIIAIRCDIRIRQRILEKANHSSDKKSSSINNSSSIHLRNPNPIDPNMTNVQIPFDIPLFTIDDIVSMTLNSIDSYPRIKRESLILEEKQRHRDNNLYLYYIDPIHQVFECIRASKKSPLNRFLNETQYSLDLIISSTISNNYSNKWEHPRMISGPSLDDIHYQSLSHSIIISMISINRFLLLITILPEYISFIEIDLEISLPNNTYSMIITLLDYEVQDNLINESYVKSNVISFKQKSQSMILYLIDEEEIHKKDLIQFISIILEINDHKEFIILDISNIIHDIIFDLLMIIKI